VENGQSGADSQEQTVRHITANSRCVAWEGMAPRTKHT
jgi:hypothetical protein